jgi:hypothetical protein
MLTHEHDPITLRHRWTLTLDDNQLTAMPAGGLRLVMFGLRMIAFGLAARPATKGEDR